ncbi:hypothetical protein JTB14_026947 [Gonioctena quinquepunctata]|nr:hypothetical protein JTB14_026947 [Gonioctena quinquepunctata]
MANNEKLSCSGAGDVIVKLKPNGHKKTISDVIFVPNLSANSLSVSTICKKGYIVAFDDAGCKMYDSEDCHIEGEAAVTATNVNGIYRLDIQEDFVNLATSTSNLWHKRLGHLNRVSMKSLRDGLASGIKFSNDDLDSPCIACIEGKQSREPFRANENKKLAKNKLDLIHRHLWSYAYPFLEFCPLYSHFH